MPIRILVDYPSGGLRQAVDVTSGTYVKDIVCAASRVLNLNASPESIELRRVFIPGTWRHARTDNIMVHANTLAAEGVGQNTMVSIHGAWGSS